MVLPFFQQHLTDNLPLALENTPIEQSTQVNNKRLIKNLLRIFRLAGKFQKVKSQDFSHSFINSLEIVL
jgi:hypothetical protein